MDGDPFAHPPKAVAEAVVGSGSAAAVVLDGDVDGVVDPDLDVCVGASGPACLRTLLSDSWTTR